MSCLLRVEVVGLCSIVSVAFGLCVYDNVLVCACVGLLALLAYLPVGFPVMSMSLALTEQEVADDKKASSARLRPSCSKQMKRVRGPAKKA